MSLAAICWRLCWHGRLLLDGRRGPAQVIAVRPKLGGSAAPSEGERHSTSERKRMLSMATLYYIALLLLLTLPMADTIRMPKTSPTQKFGKSSLQKIQNFTDNSSESALNMSNNSNNTLLALLVPTDTHVPSRYPLVDVNEENTSSDAVAVDNDQSLGTTIRGGIDLPDTIAPERVTISASITSKQFAPFKADELKPGTLKLVVGILGIVAIVVCSVIGIDQYWKLWKFSNLGAEQASTPKKAPSESEEKKFVSSLVLQSADEIKHTFTARSSGYDCLLLQPQALCGPVRIEGVVAVGPDSELRAPLARRKCVLFTTAAFEVTLNGVSDKPAAYSSRNVDFEVRMCTSSKENIKIRVRGQDVALFDMSGGGRRERSVLKDAPGHFQDFVRANPPFMQIPRESVVLDFTESLLGAGAMVTCVGELRREHTGEIGLWPMSLGVDRLTPADNNRISGPVPQTGSFLASIDTVQSSKSRNGGHGDTSPQVRGAYPHSHREPRLDGLTSWERSDASGVGRVVEKVMISDDPSLLSSSNVLRYLI